MHGTENIELIHIDTRETVNGPSKDKRSTKEYRSKRAISKPLYKERRAQQLLLVHSTTPVDCCPDGWVGYRRKCYYFAKTEGNWISSKRNCSSFSASLAVVDSQDEMDFLLRYKTSADHWIGLERDLETEPWKWVNGTIFNKWFQIRGGGKCAYINDQGAASSSCTREEPWICSKSVKRS
ncbi:C-type lectin domain family 2 member B-like [Sceloporus undulatus]|uniref:C-type lectin domain family 2 member B-like n=1 Tax=Sceloporus undulatus TaxID=8520 RepID=UPI001C4C7F9F|nr:C-type lectin domain family 2 member B-like [Sceloporus undulatus]